MKQPGWSLCTGRGGDQDVTRGPYDMENAYELLDQPGEWYLDRTAGVVFYIPKPEEDMAATRVVAPALEMLVSIAGAMDSPVHDIQFKGITFAHATFLRPGGDEGWPELEDCYTVESRRTTHRTPGNVSVQAARRVRFERCVFTHLGAVGLDIAGGSRDNVIVGCVFTDISANCIQLGNVTDPMRRDLRARDSGNQILNCYIHDSPCEFHGGCGVMAGYVSNTLISHNEIRDTPLVGVNVGWGWGARSYMEENQATFNHIHNTMSVLADGGCLKTLSPMFHSTINNNYFHDIHDVQGCMYLDNGSCHVEVYRNVCQQLRLDWIHLNNDNNDVRDNHIHDNYTDSPRLRFSGENTLSNTVEFAANAFPSAAAEIVAGAGVERAWQDVLTLPDATVVADIQGANVFKNTSLRYGYTPVRCALRILEPFQNNAGRMKGTLGLTITNQSTTQRAEGEIDVSIYPACAYSCRDAHPGSYRLGPGESIEKRLELELPPGRRVVQTRSALVGTCYSRLPLILDCQVKQLERIASVKVVAERLRDQPRFEVRRPDGQLAAGLRLAVAGANLALTAHILEERLRETDLVKSSIDIYALRPGASKITQIIFKPPTAANRAQALHQEGKEWLPTPEILLATRLTPDGYELSALVPLSMLGIAPDAKEFMLEAMASSYQPETGLFSYPALFHSVSAFANSSMFGHCIIDK